MRLLPVVTCMTLDMFLCVSLVKTSHLLQSGAKTEVTSIKYIAQRLPNKIQTRDSSCNYYCLLSAKSMFPDNLYLWRPLSVKSKASRAPRVALLVERVLGC